MTRFLRYLRYLLRHRWYVFVACLKRGLIWRGLVHDLSKFRPDEFFPYMRFYYNKKVGKEVTGGIRHAYDVAWLKHIHRNPHHHQYWILREDEGRKKILPMPYKYRAEMICDWIGAGRAQGKHDVASWYRENHRKMKLHELTREQVERELGV